MHSEGRFGAMAVVVKNGQIIFMSPNASTLPDNPHDRYKDEKGNKGKGHATILPGVYYIKSDYAGGSNKFVGFASGMNPNPHQNDSHVKVYRTFDSSGRKNPGEYPATGIDIHPGFNKPTNASSTGCVIIYRDNDYKKFMDVIGLNKGLPKPDSVYKKDQYIIGYDEPVDLPVITGAMVIDRTLADPEYLLEMYKTKEAVNLIMGK